jgi:hypothetical protein
MVYYSVFSFLLSGYKLRVFIDKSLGVNWGIGVAAMQEYSPIKEAVPGVNSARQGHADYNPSGISGIEREG